MTYLHAILAAFATYRVTRFVTADALFDPVRDRLEDIFAKRNLDRLAYLISCDWCLSIWVAPVPAAMVIFWPDNRAVLFTLFVLTFSAISGLLSAVENAIGG